MNNVVGKILIVLQLVFSLCFMCFAGAVYSFQAGWKNRATVAEQKLTNADNNLKAEQDKHNQALEDSAKKLVDEKERADGAQARVGQLTTDLQLSRDNLARTEQQRDKFQADLIVAQQEAQARIAETSDSRAEIKRLRDQVNDAIAVRRQLEDEKLDLSGQLAIVEEQKTNALKKVGDLNAKLRQEGIDPDAPLVGPVPTAIEKVDGVVTESRKNASRSAELVEVSIGSDDGVRERMKLTVFRDADFICDIEVTAVFPDSAVGRVLEETRNGTIERGDNVTTKL